MIKVFHNTKFLKYFLNGDLKEGTFKPVADVKTDDLNEAFHLTNHIDAPWHTNKNITINKDVVSPRSTSVGDLLIRDNEAFIVEFSGFKPISINDLNPQK